MTLTSTIFHGCDHTNACTTRSRSLYSILHRPDHLPLKMPAPPRLRGRAIFSLLLILLLNLVHAAEEEDQLLLAYVVLRHGARNVLPKTSTLKETSVFGGPTLLPQGKAQCVKAGQAFRARYLDTATCKATQTCLTAATGGARYGVVGSSPEIGYSNYNTLINSSALHRTLLSAQTFFAGAFGGQADTADVPALAWPVVPVFSTEDGQDWRIRPYTKCPAYDRALQQWFDSPEFSQKEQETAALRAEVQALAPGLNTSLENWWNVFDSFNVWRTCKVGDPMPEVEEETSAQVVALANWLETGKMRSGLAGNKLGGGLLGDVLGRVEQTAQAHRMGMLPGFLHYKLLGVAGHYSTLLGVLSALQVDQVKGSETALPWLRAKIPSPAAVLVFEVHYRNDEGYLVRAVWQDGPEDDYHTVPLPCGGGGGGGGGGEEDEEGFCRLQDFLALAAPQALNVGEWCRACENRDMLACRAAAR